MNAPRTNRQHPRTTPRGLPADVASVAAARDELDAVAADHRRREDASIAAYVAATKEANAIVARRDAAVAKLEEKIRATIDDAERALAATEERRASALVELNEHRSVRELSVMFGLPPKRITSYLQSRSRAAGLADEPVPPSDAADNGHPAPAVEGDPAEPALVPGGDAATPPRPVDRSTSPVSAEPEKAHPRHVSPEDRAQKPTGDVSQPDAASTDAERLF